MIDRNYRCDLCRDMHNLNSMTGLNQLIGIYWVGKIIEERPPHDVEHHLCVKCLSSIQAMPKRCGQGFECTGGPKCGSDHK